MSKLDKLQRLDLLGLTPQSQAAPFAPIKLDEDESPLDWPEALKAEWATQFQRSAWNRFPPEHTDLKRAIAEPFGLGHEWVSLGAGVPEVLRHLLMAWCLKGTLIYPVPTDPLYGLVAQTLGIKHVAVMLKADFTLPLDQLIGTAEAQEASVVLVANPNNPTGNLLARDELLTIVRGAPSLVVVDESYIDFTGLSLADALGEHDNLVILRSFSHAWHAAGFRLGYALAHPRVIIELEKVRLPHNLPAPSLLAGQMLLAHAQALRPRWLEVVQARESLRQALGSVRGVVTWPSAANFLLVGTTMPGVELARRLLEMGVLVRTFTRSPLLNCVRVTVGDDEANTAFLAAMQEIFGFAG